MNTELIILELAVLFAIVGLVIVLKASFLFKRIPGDILRAKVFLAKSFLYRNLILVFIVSALVALHTVLEFIKYGYILKAYELDIQILYTLTLAVAMFLVAVLAYLWCRLLK